MVETQEEADALDRKINALEEQLDMDDLEPDEDPPEVLSLTEYSYAYGDVMAVTRAKPKPREWTRIDATIDSGRRVLVYRTIWYQKAQRSNLATTVRRLIRLPATTRL